MTSESDDQTPFIRPDAKGSLPERFLEWLPERLLKRRLGL